MTKRILMVLLVALVAAACSQKKAGEEKAEKKTPVVKPGGEEKPAGEEGKEMGHMHEGHEGHAHAKGEGSTTQMENVAAAPGSDEAETMRKTLYGQKAHDPVCDMTVGISKGTPYTVSGGHFVHFCSEHCKEAFEKDPEKYLKETP